MARTNIQIAREARRRTNTRRSLAARPEARTQIDTIRFQGVVVEEPVVERCHGTAIPQEA